MKKATKEKNIDADKKNSKGNKKKKFKKAVILFVIIGAVVIGMLFAKMIIPAQNATKKYNIAVKEYPESVKFHFYKNKPISVVIFYRLHTNYNQSYRSKGHTTPLEFQ